MNHLLPVLTRSAFLFSFWHTHFTSFRFFTFKDKNSDFERITFQIPPQDHFFSESSTQILLKDKKQYQWCHVGYDVIDSLQRWVEPTLFVALDLLR